MEDHIDTSLVLDWNARSKRTNRKAPVTYWEEYVQTDDWYLKKLVEDVPPEEMWAACEDEDFANDEDSEGVAEILSDEQDYDPSSSPTDDEFDSVELCEEESVQWATEGESGSEGEDGESASGSVG